MIFRFGGDINPDYTNCYQGLNFMQFTKKNTKIKQCITFIKLDSHDFVRTPTNDKNYEF